MLFARYCYFLFLSVILFLFFNEQKSFLLRISLVALVCIIVIIVFIIILSFPFSRCCFVKLNITLARVLNIFYIYYYNLILERDITDIVSVSCYTYSSILVSLIIIKIYLNTVIVIVLSMLSLFLLVNKICKIKNIVLS